MTIPLRLSLWIAVIAAGFNPQNNTAPIRLANDRAAITVESASGAWSATWGADAAINGAAFRLDVNGATIGGKPETSGPQAFSDALGKGRQLRQTLRAASLRVERELRLYDDGAITLGGRIINESPGDLRLETAQLMRAAWRLGQMTEAPAAVVMRNQLRERHGLKFGLWISPTDVADTSELYRQHPDWVLHGDDGQPKVNWKWFWKPNPNCYQLDASRPEVTDHIARRFKQLASEGVSYFKIDFIGSQGKEVFAPRDTTVTRGWPVLRHAMQAVRDGAGPESWIRYCQGPPLLSAGLADGSYGGDDTADAGQPGMFRVLRDNARILATSFWVNDRAYTREVCDMSMRMHADIEEARVRAAIMTLANASISWSDELSYLPPSRIRMMQQCMPPGNPPMRPVDLFDRDIPSVWHIPAKNDADAWDVVGLFNFNDKAETRGLRFADLGLDAKSDYAVFEFWEEKFLGVVKGGVELTLPPESSRILSIRKVSGRPQLIGADMHLLQGYHELKQLVWDESRLVLSGRYERMPGLQSKAFFLVPAGFAPKFEFPLSPRSARLTHVAGNLWMQEVEFKDRDYVWAIPFEQVKSPAVKEPNQ